MLRQNCTRRNAEILCTPVEDWPALQRNLFHSGKETSGTCLLRQEQVRQRFRCVWLFFVCVSNSLVHYSELISNIEMQQRIGYVDVKSEPVYFFVQRYDSFDSHNSIIPFQIERLNVGRAFDLSSDIFTAPKPGKYFFSFSGNRDGVDDMFHLWMALRLNDTEIAYPLGRSPRLWYFAITESDWERRERLLNWKLALKSHCFYLQGICHTMIPNSQAGWLKSSCSLKNRQ